MRRIIAAGLSLVALGAAAAHARTSVISPTGSRSSATGSAEYFSGAVIVDPLFGANESMAATGGLVTFAPSARSAWHTHPAGQILIVTTGMGAGRGRGEARDQGR